jgi:cell division protein FtsX
LTGGGRGSAVSTDKSDIIGVLHFVGAKGKFIAREVQRHFLRFGLRAGSIGAGAARGDQTTLCSAASRLMFPAISPSPASASASPFTGSAFAGLD